MKQQKIFCTIMLAWIALLGTSACSDAADKISVRLKWKHGAQFAGFYVAEKKGFYAEEELEVTLRPGGLEYDEIDLVVSGEDDFAVFDASHVITARSRGTPVVVFAIIYRISPIVYFALKESGITRPHDFIGKRVLVNPADFTLPAMMRKLELDMNLLQAVPPTYDMSPFFAGEVDVWNGYLTSQVILSRRKGYELNIIYPDDYGVHFYMDCLLATEKTLVERPELVERFLRATLRGWHYAIEHPAETATFSLDYDSTLELALQQDVMETQIPLIHTGEDHIGWMRADIWQGMHDTLLEQGILHAPVPLESVYTMEFLQRIYHEE